MKKSVYLNGKKLQRQTMNIADAANMIRKMIELKYPNQLAKHPTATIMKKMRVSRNAFSYDTTTADQVTLDELMAASELNTQ